MPEKLFVGGLPFDFSDDQLRNLFAKAGTVLAAVMVPDPKNNRTRGFGFVTLPGKQEALAAMEMLKGTKVGEKTIYITEAREKPPRKAPPPPRPPGPPRFPHPSIDERKPSYRDPRSERRPRPYGSRHSFRPASRDEGASPFQQGPARGRGPRPFTGRPSFRPSSPDGRTSPFSGPPRERGKPFGGRRPDRPSSGPRHARSGKPAKKPFYQKFAKPGRNDRAPETGA